MKQLVNIIIPIYKNQLSKEEEISLQQVYSVLGGYPLTVVKPAKLDISEITRKYPALVVDSFPDDYFKGISGYNKLMLSSEFYERFLDYTYILIYQLDAYVFRDELVAWCNKGYDYIGAPWLEKPLYLLPVIKQWMKVSLTLHLWRKKNDKQLLYNKVGNGGFSLRKVKSHYDATIRYRERIDYFLRQPKSHFFYEDVFWATEVSEFKYPQPIEALKFSFDKYPTYCYKLNNNQLPFGCHAWYKRKMKKFWHTYITF